MVSAWRNFKHIFSRPLFTIIFRPEMLKFHPYSVLTRDTMVGFVIFCVLSIFWLLSFHILGLETLWIYKLSEWHGGGSNFRTTELWGFRSSTMGFTTLLSWLTMELYLFWKSILCTFSLEICETVRLRKYEIFGVTTIEVCCFYNQYLDHTIFQILKIPY